MDKLIPSTSKIKELQDKFAYNKKEVLQGIIGSFLKNADDEWSATPEARLAPSDVARYGVTEAAIAQAFLEKFGSAVKVTQTAPGVFAAEWEFFTNALYKKEMVKFAQDLGGAMQVAASNGSAFTEIAGYISAFPELLKHLEDQGYNVAEDTEKVVSFVRFPQ